MSLSKLNYVNVGRDGTFASSGDVNSTPADVDALMAHLRSEAKNHVVIHLHGGLVSESAGMGVAESMLPTYEAAGAHPVSIVYETGFLETLQGNLSSIHETKLFGKLIKYVRKFTARKLGLDALEGIADAEPDLTRPASELESDPWFTALEGAPLEAPEAVGESEEAAQAEIERWLESDEEMPAIIREEARMDVVQAESIADKDEAIFTWAATARTILQIGTRVTGRLWRNRDHGAYCTIVEEILREAFVADFGQWTWSSMKTKAHEMFQSNEGRTGLDQRAARYLMDGLAALQAENPALCVDVVGHSLGSVATCHLLDAMTGSLRVRRIALLAPAVRTEVARAALFSKPERFEDFRLFTMTDKYEVDDELAGFIYPRSLLYFISGVLERSAVDETILGMARHLTGTSPYDDAHLQEIVAFLGAEEPRTVWSVTSVDAPEGRRSTSESHGGFDDDPKTRESLTQYLGAP